MMVEEKSSSETQICVLSIFWLERTKIWEGSQQQSRSLKHHEGGNPTNDGPILQLQGDKKQLKIIVSNQNFKKRRALTDR